MKNMLDGSVKLEKFGTVPEGNYELTLTGIMLKEAVVSLPAKNPVVTKEFMKLVRNKERGELTPEQVRQIESLDLGADGIFEKTGDAKPRFQNRVIFNFIDAQGNKHSSEFFGGPKLNTALTNFVKNSLGIEDINAVMGRDWSELYKSGDKFTAHIKLDGDFNRVDVDTVRKVGLTPVSGNSNSGEFSPTAKALLKYLQTEGKGMSTGDIAQLYTKNVTVDGITLNNNGPLMLAFGEIKAKVKQYQVDGKIDIVL